jgi:solute:Na+ symporter, SSS family
VNLSWVDWAIVIAAVIGLRYVSISTRNFMKGVADFLAAGRCAGRYLLTNAAYMGNYGAIHYVASFEVCYLAGLPPVWWGLMQIPVPVIIYLSGWVYWRFRETRALTLSQFLEMRYSRRFRIFCGILMWVCGILNFGIFPAVAARFLIYFCGLPDYFHIPGIWFPISTFAVVMAVDLALSLLFVTMGGQVTVMVTECVQGIFAILACMVIVSVVLLMVGWPQIVQGLSAATAAAPPGHSFLHPYHTGAVKDFNVWFYAITIFGSFYGALSWQGCQGFYTSARNPHEQRMGFLLGTWRQIPPVLTGLVLGIAALAVMKLPQFAGIADIVNAKVDDISLTNAYIGQQMLVPIALAHFLPIGIKGLLVTVTLFASFSCNDTYMHSWGTIFVQDVALPIRETLGKKPLSTDQHIRLLRWSIVFVAFFSFLFGLFYKQTGAILMFFAVTGIIWTGGSGAVIIGGLYWKRGSTLAAYLALILGAVLGLLGLFAQQIWQYFFQRDFPINNQVLLFFAMISATLVYIAVSLLFGRKDKAANLEKILHRGKYAAAGEAPAQKTSVRTRMKEFVGIHKDFTLSDRILAVALLAWTFGWFIVFAVVTVIHFTSATGTTIEWWAKVWHVYIFAQLAVGIPATIWFAIGGVVDIRSLFRTLATAVRDETDDGRVIHEPDDTVEDKAGEGDGPAAQPPE